MVPVKSSPRFIARIAVATALFFLADARLAQAQLGACCLPGKPCAELSPRNCDILGGVFLGEGTNCDPDLCAICSSDNPDDCCSEGDTVGCNDPDCCGCVCLNQDICCDVEWVQGCADVAVDPNGPCVAECEACQCGNGVCQEFEDCATCAADCPCPPGTQCVGGMCETFCGNGTCEIDENCETCPADCGCPPEEICIDGLCEPDPCPGDLPLGTAFSYQGQLVLDGIPVNDTCEFEFSLFDAPVGCSPIVPTLTRTVTVTDGGFTVLLDFGGIFDGTARWLEIAVCCPSPCGDFTTLTPRQELTPTPHALALPGLRTVQNDISPKIIGGFSGNGGATPEQVVGTTISGGGEAGAINRVTGDFGTVGGGKSNTAGLEGTVGGGIGNAAGPGGTVGGGQVSIADGIESTVGGGALNIAVGDHSTIAGGSLNSAFGESSTISGGVFNDADGQRATVGGGEQNSAGGDFSTVGGGISNVAGPGVEATVGGGDRNEATGNSATVGGGAINTASGVSATIAGGSGNNATAVGATIGGGVSNTASDINATVAGGFGNTASDINATVGGGVFNIATNVEATIGGGAFNFASGLRATIGGGEFNVASGRSATIAGGADCTASGDYSFAAGRRAKAVNIGSFVWADSTDEDLGSFFGDNTFTVRASGGTVIYSDPIGSTGVIMFPGNNAWSAVSDRSLKANFAPVDGRDILERLASVPVETWNLKSQDPSIRHIGPMAQDFYAAFSVGGSNKHISTSDADGVALAAIQGLYQIAQNRDEQIANRDEQIAELRGRVAALEALVQRLASPPKGDTQ